MEFLFGLMAGMAFWPTLIGVVATLGICVAMEKDENWIFATIVFVLAFVASWVLTEFSPVDLAKYVYNNPGDASLYVAKYFAAGVIWSLFRWLVLSWQRGGEVKRKSQAFIERWKEILNDSQASRREDAWRENITSDSPYSEERRKEVLDQLNRGKIPDLLLDTWRKKPEPAFTGKTFIPVKPSPLSHGPRIVTWICWWPWNALWYILFRFFYEFATWLCERLIKVYELITYIAFRLRGVDERLLRKSYR